MASAPRSINPKVEGSSPFTHPIAYCAIKALVSSTLVLDPSIPVLCGIVARVFERAALMAAEEIGGYFMDG